MIKGCLATKPLQRIGSAELLHTLFFGGFPLSHLLEIHHLNPAR